MPNLVINAGPGTGKTYTITSIPKYLRATNRQLYLRNNKHTEEQLAIWQWAERNIHFDGKPSILYSTYNADMVEEVIPQLPSSVKALTIHGAGYSILNRKFGYLKINRNRGAMIVEKVTGKNFHALKDKFKWICTLKYLEKLKDELLDISDENFLLLKNKYEELASYPMHPDMVNQANKLILEMKKVDRVIGIEYIDQVWLALFATPSSIFDLGLIDEAQDLSPARLMLTRRLCRDLVYTGDPEQAVNAFSGADPHAFEKIQLFCDAELPLKISFRNPPNIVQMSNALMNRPIIQPLHPRKQLRGLDKPAGREIRLSITAFTSNIPTDYRQAMIISRTNAALVSCALKLMKAEIPCAISGNQLVDTLCKMVRDFNAVDFDELQDQLDEWQTKACRNSKEYLKEMIKDKADCIRLVIPHCESITEVEDKLKELFTPKEKSFVTLSTIHKSKGKEREHVFILFPPIESRFALSPEQKQQEQNLHNTAITRTSKDLYWIFQE